MGILRDMISGAGKAAKKQPAVPPVVKKKLGRRPKARPPKPTTEPPAAAEPPLDGRSGRTRTMTSEEAGQRQREATARYRDRTVRASRDIAGRVDFTGIDWGRRLACKYDVGRFDKTYMPDTFRLGWARDHLICNQRIMDVFLRGGSFALAMPRGGGKTALCRGGLLWGTAYGHRSFPFLVGSTSRRSIGGGDWRANSTLDGSTKPTCRTRSASGGPGTI